MDLNWGVGGHAQVLVEEGEAVEAGAPLLVLEAMKMEHVVRAPCAGTVTQLSCSPASQIEDGAILTVIVPPSLKSN